MAKKEERPAVLKAQNQRDIARLYLKEGLTQAAIAERLGISQATVSRDLKSLKAGWQREGKQEVDRWRHKMLGELAQVRAASWEGWYSENNPAFLREVRGAIMDAHKVMGLDKLIIQELPPDMSQLSDEELASIAAGKATS